MEKGFDSFIKTRQYQINKENFLANPFIPYYYELFVKDVEKVPVKNVRLVLSFFLRN